MSLAIKVMDLEEKNTKLQAENKELSGKVAALSIFEPAVNEMRKLLDSEVESKHALEQELAASYNLQK